MDMWNKLGVALWQTVLGPMLLVSLLSGPHASAEAAAHPLDPLQAEEYASAIAILKTAKRATDESRYPLITLQEPPKAEVRRWKPGDPVRRAAFLVVKDGPRTFEAVVDLSAGTVTSWKEVSGAQSSLLMEEWMTAQKLVLEHPEWQAAARKRGFSSFEEVVCIPATAGYFGLAEEEGRRLFKVPCFDGRGTKNFWGRPIEGLTAVVDIDRSEVIKLIDTGAVPIPQAPVDLDPGSVGTLRNVPAPNTLAVNHDHFFNFRLDLDVDGSENSLLVEALKPKRLGPESPRQSIWVVEPRTAKSEQEAKLQVMMEKPALWRAINPNVRGPLGYPVSYELVPGHVAFSLLTATDFPQRRAGFTDYQLWVTPYRPEERYAGGMYPNQSKGGDGLPAWTSANRPIENTDIVLWYTLGLHHVVRAEDWPVLPTVWHEFELRPFDFFARNPALDLPPQTKQSSN
jgi:Cu2+-containing amine oxidase